MKKIMKKMIFMITVFSMVFMMTGCFANNNKGKDKIIIGFDNTFVPMGFLDENGDVVGFDVDLAKEAFKRLGKEVEFQPIDWSMKETELNNGNVDVLWNGYSLNEEREKIVSFSNPYLKNKQVIMTMSNSNINTKEDLKGKEVGTQQGSTAQEAVEDDKSFIKTLKNGNIVLYDTYDKALRDLEIGRTSAVVGDEVLIRYYISQKGEEKYKILEENFGFEDYVVAFAKDNTSLRDDINKELKSMKNDKTIDKIYKKWFK